MRQKTLPFSELDWQCPRCLHVGDADDFEVLEVYADEYDGTDYEHHWRAMWMPGRYDSLYCLTCRAVITWRERLIEQENQCHSTT